MPKKPKTKRQLIKIADRWFSQYIRLKAATGTGFCTCVTCGKVLPWNRGIHAGHFIGRMWIKTRYNTHNVNVQCCHCNMFLGGNPENYYPYMLDKYGQDHINYLRELSREAPNSLSGTELEDITIWAKDVVKELRKEKGL